MAVMLLPRFMLALSCLFFWLLPGILLAQPLILTDSREQVSTIPDLMMFPDTSGQLGIEQVSSPEFAGRFQATTWDQHSQLIHEATTPHVWWMRLDIQQSGNTGWYLVSDTPMLAHMDAYIVDPANQSIRFAGNMRKENSWQRLPTLQLPPVQTASSYQIYLRSSSRSSIWKHIPFQLMSADALNQQTAHDYLVYGGIIMGLLALASYNLFLFVSLRDRSYLTLVAFLLSLVLVLQRIYNVIPWLSFISNPDLPWFTGSVNLLLLSCIQFWRQLLGTKNLIPTLDRIFTPLSLLILGMTAVIPWLPEAELWSFVLIVVVTLFGSTAGGVAAYRGSRMILSVAPGTIVFVGCAMPITLWRLGLFEYADPALLNDIFALGTLATGILLSLTLAEHTRQIRIRAEQAAIENRVKDEFLTTMSHELRTPVNSVVVTAELLKQSQLPVREQEYVSRLETVSRHMLELINNILDLARLQVTTITLHNEVFHLPTLLNRLQQMLQTSATAKNLTLRLHSAAIPDLYLKGDPQRLSQVLLNLLGNAIKFTDQGSIDLYVREAGSTDNGDIRLHFEVADTGIGIAPEDQSRLFQPFNQIDNQRTRRHGGFGLGLAISRKLVEAMGGKLEMDSVAGEGSRFFFTLTFPLQTNSPTEACPASDSSEESSAKLAPATAIANKHILLVDDDEMNRFFGRELLNRLNATTTAVDSGAEAIHQLEQHTFDLIFMDVSMPEMDGYETTRKIRTDPRFAKLPIIALTAHAITGEKERCLDAGMNDYLTKPFALVDMQTLLLRWLKTDTRP
ncbi:hybrid sensor histidine kinase/response regulator [Thiothrix nivea]|uniref:histidine kinase n=1 Tax=Thiothrix nivea (strain ATCC 35100 / DSM 5205 / JP2) TaxID=870187 RepID=A0A656HEL2_THINJ|nr:hybrid sensor histidine kinase/response regulator [Thiothrix nivea]EIJ35531.1 integral membrane sensor hybrid histidine kinase [Thiothrix nivea DSM 5205]